MLFYRVRLRADDNGTLLATCPDLPEVTTFGEDEADALMRARDAIEEAIAARMAHKEDIPPPAAEKARGGRGRWRSVALPNQTVMKVALYRAMRERGLRRADLARLLRAHGPQVDRLLDVRHASRLDQMEAALAALGKRLIVGVENNA